MLYPTLRLIAGVALRWYYREVSIRGVERIPATGPVLLAVNHPNAMVDAMIVAWLVPRRVRITAKAVLFDQPALRVLMRALGVIPLRRASDELRKRGAGGRGPGGRGADPPGSGAPGTVQSRVGESRPGTLAEDAPDAAGQADAGFRADPSRNAASFAAILDALDAGAAVLIFPEGRSHDEPALAPLKTGPARIALAAHDAGRAAGLRIVPIGLVFEAKDAVRSRVVAVVGDPIAVDDWAPAGGEASRPEALTRAIAEWLGEVVLVAPTAERLALVQRAAHLAAAILAPAAPAVGAVPSLRDEYAIAARVAHGLDRLDALPPALRSEAEATLGDVDAFGRALEEAGIAAMDAAISLRVRHGARFVVREVALLACAGPLAAFGRVTHWVPFRFARRAALRDVTARDQPAMRTIVAGLALVLVAYVIQVAVVGAVAGWWVAAAYLALLPIGADVDLRYTDRLRLAWRRMRTYLHLRRDPALAATLDRRRSEIAARIRQLDAELTVLERTDAAATGAVSPRPAEEARARRDPSATPRRANPSGDP